MKRSRGVTALAIFLVVLGTLQILGYAASLTLLPGFRSKDLSLLESAQRQSRLSDDRLRAMLSDSNLDPARRQTLEEVARSDSVLNDQMRAMLEFERQRVEYENSEPSMQEARVGLALGFVLLFGAFGVFRLKPWSQAVILGQATLTVLAGLWEAMTLLPQLREVMQTGLTMAQALKMPAWEARMAHLVDFGAAYKFGSLVLGYLVWAGFIFWFFNRESVKRQFGSTPELEFSEK